VRAEKRAATSHHFAIYCCNGAEKKRARSGELKKKEEKHLTRISLIRRFVEKLYFDPGCPARHGGEKGRGRGVCVGLRNLGVGRKAVA